MKNRNIVVQTLSLISQLGISMVVPILLCTVFGVWLERKLTVSLTIPLIVLGVLAGARNVYVILRHAKNMIESEESEEE